MKRAKSKYTEIIRYVIVGVLTTMVSLLSYFSLVHTFLNANNPIHLQIANATSWIIAVIFAFFTNRRFVFRSGEKNVLKQFLKFCCSRIGTLLIEMLFMFVMVTLLKNDDTISKILAQIVIMVLNYILSKLFVFNDMKNVNAINIFKKLSKNDYFWPVIVFVLLVLLCYLFPYTGDDWSWGSSVGIDRLNSGFVDYGGRYFGYIIVLVLTRFRILRAIVMAGTIVGIAWGARCIVKQKWAFYAAILLMFLVSNEIFAQSISWTSGFSNYATTALMVIAFLAVIFNNVFQSKPETIWIKTAMPILGFCGSLIMESITVFFVIMPILLQIYLWKKEKRFSPILILFAIGAMVGAALMFSNSTYTNIMNTNDGYRTMSFSVGELLSRAKDNYLTTIYPYGLFKNEIIVISFIIGGFLLLGSNKDKRNRFSIATLTILGVFLLINILSNVVIGATNKPTIFVIFEAILSSVAIVSMFLFSISITEKKSNERRTMIILWLTFAILIGPLFVVTPIGPRNFFLPYVMLMIICLILWNSVFNSYKTNYKKLAATILPLMNRVVLAGAVIVVSIYVCIFAVVYIKDVTRIDEIRREIAAGKTRVELKRLPFQSLMWVSNPTFDAYMERYKMFYEIPMEIEVVNEWLSE